MKLNNRLLITMTVAAMTFSACDPIEDRDVLKNSYNPDDIQLEVVQTADGKGNGLTLKMKTPGVIGYWDYLIDQKYTDEAYVVYPIPGTHTFNYIVSIPYLKDGNPANREVVSKSIDVTIEVLDQPLPQAYYDLIGQELEGKAWVFDGTGADGGLWWFMSDPGNPEAVWWNAGGDCCPPDDVNGRMVFELSDGAKYTYYTDDGSDGEVGSFRFNANYTKLYIGGGKNILGATFQGSGNNDGEYTIVELSADRLVLHTDKNDAGTGWTWVFVPAE